MTDAPRRNALSFEMMTALRDAFVEVGATDTYVVVLAAEGPVFSAGHNLKDMVDITTEDSQALFTLAGELMTTMQSIPQPVIAKIQGVAAAGGLQLAVSCDLAVSVDTATFSLPGIKFGIFCHTPGVAVARTIGMKRVLELLLTGDAIDAAKAEAWGLINHAVPADELDATVTDLATRISQAGPAFGRTVGKRIFYRQIELDVAQAYDLTAGVLAEMAVGADAQEGVRSFVEKRKPVFTSTPQGV